MLLLCLNKWTYRHDFLTIWYIDIILFFEPQRRYNILRPAQWGR